MDVEIVGEGPDLVLLHSLLTDRTSYAALAARLSSRRRVLLVNMPGFGSSPKAQPLDGYADSIAAFFREQALPADTDIIGNGLGGFVGLRFAVRHGALFNRLVVIGSAVAFPEAGRATFSAMADRAETSGMPALTGAAMLRMFPEDYIDAHPDVIADRRRVFEAIDAGVFAAACRALAGLDLAPDLDRITRPVQVVVGARDTATSPPLGRELAARLPHAEFVELAGVGHAPHIQSPDALLAAIAPFLGLAGGA